MAGEAEPSRTATYATLLVVIVFCTVVGVGWWFLVSPQYSQFIGSKPGRHAASVGTAFLIMLIAAYCARVISQYRADAFRRNEKRTWYMGWKPYILLAVISALGTLNSAFVFFESRAILRQDIAVVRDNYGLLWAAAHKVLPSQPYAEKTAKMESLLKRLHEEIVNPNGGNFCGVGPSARSIITDMSAILPNYPVINGTGPIRPCDIGKAERVYQSYADNAHQMIKADDAYLRDNGPNKASFLEKLDQNFNRAIAQLGALEASSSGIGPSATVDQSPLYAARTSFNTDRRTYLSLSGDDPTSITSIDTLQSDEVSSYASTLSLLAKRAGQVTTWFYVAIALALDFAVIYLLTELNLQQPKRQAVIGVVAEDKPFESDPQFLWVNRK